MRNAGERLWLTQLQQKTGLCVGLDPHYEPDGALNKEFYSQFAISGDDLWDLFAAVVRITRSVSSESAVQEQRTEDSLGTEDSLVFLTGLTRYYLRVVRAAWNCGIRVFKLQASFYERLGLAGNAVLAVLCGELKRLAARSGEPYFTIFDGKRGDIDSTMAAYYAAYLSGPHDEVIPGLSGQYDFDTMTVTTWLGGNDVLAPGLPFFKRGKGAIVVTRTTNPSGATLQDAVVLPSDLGANPAGGRFRYDRVMHQDLVSFLDRDPTAHELMLWITTQFSADHGFYQDGVSPLFSVMGSTVEMSQSFRRIRGNGAIALVPAFGHQGGNFKNIEPLLVREGPLEGHWGILASARAHNFPWMRQYGGSGNPTHLEQEMARAINGFRVAERQAYEDAGAFYPF